MEMDLESETICNYIVPTFVYFIHVKKACVIGTANSREVQQSNYSLPKTAPAYVLPPISHLCSQASTHSAANVQTW